MKSVLIVFLALFIGGCAGSGGGRYDGHSRGVAFLTIKNTLNKTARIYWQSHNERPIYLGRVKAKRRKTLRIKGPFFDEGFRIIARPTLGRAIIANVPVGIEHGEKAVWVLSKNNLKWKRSER